MKQNGNTGQCYFTEKILIKKQAKMNSDGGDS